MSPSPELIDAAKALGLFNAQGDFDSTWFEHAFDRLQRILSNPTQRDALLSLLDRVAPPATISGLPAGEKWHPLLGTQTRGNAYVTVKPVSGGVVLGLAGEVHGDAGGGPGSRARPGGFGHGAPAHRPRADSGRRDHSAAGADPRSGQRRPWQRRGGAGREGTATR